MDMGGYSKQAQVIKIILRFRVSHSGRFLQLARRLWASLSEALTFPRVETMLCEAVVVLGKISHAR
jgi:hypothetical protein